jgi:hypothetical protein
MTETIVRFLQHSNFSIIMLIENREYNFRGAVSWKSTLKS